MAGSVFDKVMDVAADQYGYLTTAQGRERGVSSNAIRMMADRGTLERVARGVYRVPTFPPSPYAEYMEASLWPAGVRGVISHDSALVLRGLSDISPSRVHITVPETFRIRRNIPSHLVVHHAPLLDHEATVFQSIPVTAVRRTFEDCHRSHVGPTLLRQALTDAEREGFLSPREAKDLGERILPRNAVR